MKLKNILLLSIFALSFTACNNKQKNTAEESLPILRPSEIITTGQDTTEVMDLVNQYMALFANNDLEGASSLLYHVKNDSVHPYTAEERQDFKNHLSIFSVYDYKVNGIIFRSDKNNEVNVRIQIVPDGNISEGKGTTEFVFNPVKIDNHWYLTLMDLQAEGVRRYYDK